MSIKNWLRFLAMGLVWGSTFFWVKIGLQEVGPFSLYSSDPHRYHRADDLLFVQPQEISLEVLAFIRVPWILQHSVFIDPGFVE
jgi:hypothetical protein